MIREYLGRVRRKGCVVAMSGGIDSSVVASLWTGPGNLKRNGVEIRLGGSHVRLPPIEDRELAPENVHAHQASDGLVGIDAQSPPRPVEDAECQAQDDCQDKDKPHDVIPAYRRPADAVPSCRRMKAFARSRSPVLSRSNAAAR